MRRLNLAFLAVVVVAAAVGGAAAVQFRDDLGAVSTVLAVEDRVGMEVTAAALTDRGVEVSARVENPTGYRFRVPGGVVSAQNATRAGLAYGAGRRLDDNEVLPPKGSVTVRLVLDLGPTQRDRVAAAVAAGDATATVTLPVYYGDTRFTVTGRRAIDGGDG